MDRLENRDSNPCHLLLGCFKKRYHFLMHWNFELLWLWKVKACQIAKNTLFKYHYWTLVYSYTHFYSLKNRINLQRLFTQCSHLPPNAFTISLEQGIFTVWNILKVFDYDTTGSCFMACRICSCFVKPEFILSDKKWHLAAWFL